MRIVPLRSVGLAPDASSYPVDPDRRFSPNENWHDEEDDGHLADLRLLERAGQSWSEAWRFSVTNGFDGFCD
jgi:hypothetical protein